MRYWAKTIENGLPGISVHAHCCNVGCVADVLFDLLPVKLVPKNLAVWLAACHDIGKISPGFESKSPAWLVQNGFVALAQTRLWRDAEPDHSKVSQFTLQMLLRERPGVSRSTAALWAAVAGMHHGTPHWRGGWQTSPQGIDVDIEWERKHRALTEALRSLPVIRWEEERRKLAQALQTLAPMPETLPLVDLNDCSALWWTAGLITVADWIGSDEHFFAPEKEDETEDPSATQQRARAALAQIGLEPPRLEAGRTFQELFDNPPRPLQEAALEFIRAPGVYVVEAPMGLGKTEAALAAAYRLIGDGQASGLYFALPTQATSNAMHGRVAGFLARIQTVEPRLIHGNSWLVDPKLSFPQLDAGQGRDQAQDERSDARDWFASAKRALLAPYGVGTVDQALLGVIAVKHFFVRHFALAGKVVVLDEVHSYDVFTGTLIEALVEALVKLRCTVIVLSATLTGARRRELLVAGSSETAVPPVTENEAFPLITGVTEGQYVSSCQIELPPPGPPVTVRFCPEEAALAGAVAAVRAGARVLWICNTVERAQVTYRTLCGERCEGDPPVGLLHARFPFYRREQLETDWLHLLGKVADINELPAACLLISTQVVEQSVDVDADLLITELAPTDMLFQRLGRLWRHPRGRRPRSQPEVWIIEESEPFEALRSEPDKRLICKVLGKKANVYAPYVLLRSLEQWHDRPEVRVPGDIRCWLEATYRERDEVERPAWAALLKELLDKRNGHAGRAKFFQNRWNLEALKDEEGLGTRLIGQKTLPLVLLSEAGDGRVTFLDGTELPVQSRRFDYETARALHRNLVKAPDWWFARKEGLLKSVPSPVAAMVGLHLRGRVEVGVLAGREIRLESLSEGDALEYDDATGLSRLPGTGTDAEAVRPDYYEEDYDVN